MVIRFIITYGSLYWPLLQLLPYFVLCYRVKQDEFFLGGCMTSGDSYGTITADVGILNTLATPAHKFSLSQDHRFPQKVQLPPSKCAGFMIAFYILAFAPKF